MKSFLLLFSAILFHPPSFALDISEEEFIKSFHLVPFEGPESASTARQIYDEHQCNISIEDQSGKTLSEPLEIKSLHSDNKGMITAINDSSLFAPEFLVTLSLKYYEHMGRYQIRFSTMVDSVRGDRHPEIEIWQNNLSNLSLKLGARNRILGFRLRCDEGKSKLAANPLQPKLDEKIPFKLEVEFKRNPAIETFLLDELTKRVSDLQSEKDLSGVFFYLYSKSKEFDLPKTISDFFLKKGSFGNGNDGKSKYIIKQQIVDMLMNRQLDEEDSVEIFAYGLRVAAKYGVANLSAKEIENLIANYQNDLQSAHDADSMSESISKSLSKTGIEIF